MDTHPGLRERKKQRTREAIIRAAHELFVERGYTGTTLNEIAEAADVSTRTIFGYFTGKEDILFANLDRQRSALIGALADRAHGSDVLDAVRDFVSTASKSPRSELDDQLWRVISQDPMLRELRDARLAQVVEVIGPAMAAQLHLAQDDLGAHLATASLAAGLGQLLDHGARKGTRLTPDEALAVIDPVITFIRAGLTALTRYQHGPP